MAAYAMPTPNCSIRRSFSRFTFFFSEYTFHHLCHLLMYMCVWCRRTKGQVIQMLVTNKTWTQMWMTEAGWVRTIVGTKKRLIKKENSENWLKGKVSEKERNVWSKTLLLFRVLTAWNVKAEINVVSHTHTHSHTARCSLTNEQAAVWSP